MSRGTITAIVPPKVLTSGLTPLRRASDYSLIQLRNSALPVDLDIVSDGLLFGPLVSDRGVIFQPLASVSLREEGEGLHVCLRLGVYYVDRNGELAADGWRFESGEMATGAPHPWAHVQRTIGWRKDDHSLLVPLGLESVSEQMAQNREGRCPHIVNESRPAIPLGCSSPAGLALTMIGSVHGAPFVQGLFEGDEKLKRGVLQVERDVLRLRT